MPEMTGLKGAAASPAVVDVAMLDAIEFATAAAAASVVVAAAEEEEVDEVAVSTAAAEAEAPPDGEALKNLREEEENVS